MQHQDCVAVFVNGSIESPFLPGSRLAPVFVNLNVAFGLPCSDVATEAQVTVEHVSSRRGVEEYRIVLQLGARSTATSGE